MIIITSSFSRSFAFKNNAMPAFSNPSCLKSVLEKLSFRDELMLTEGLTGERLKAPFSNFSNAVWTRPNFSPLKWFWRLFSWVLRSIVLYTRLTGYFFLSRFRQIKQQYDLKVHEAELVQARLKQSTHHHQLEEVEALQKTVGKLSVQYHKEQIIPWKSELSFKNFREFKQYASINQSINRPFYSCLLGDQAFE